MKLGKKGAGILTKLWEGMAPWVMERYNVQNIKYLAQHGWNARKTEMNTHEQQINSNFSLEQKEKKNHRDYLWAHWLCVSMCLFTCVCTSASLNSMNQWLEKRPAFCRVRDLLLLSQTTRRCGRRRTSCWTNTHGHSLSEKKKTGETFSHKSCLY